MAKSWGALAGLTHRPIPRSFEPDPMHLFADLLASTTAGRATADAAQITQAGPRIQKSRRGCGGQISP